MEIILTIILAIVTYGFGFFSGVINNTQNDKTQTNKKPINKDRKEAFEFAFKDYINK